MQTLMWNVKENPEAIEQAAHIIQAGSLVAFPTETVYGLGADATNEEAVNKIFQVKKRPRDNPLIVHVATQSQFRKFCGEISPNVQKLIDAFTPGPITFVLEGNDQVAPSVKAGQSTIAIRIPNHPVALELIERTSVPIAAPSANISGKPSPTTAKHVWRDLAGRISGILDAGLTNIGMESTVIDCTKKIPVILRPGGITKEQIEEVIGQVYIYDAKKEVENIQSPGMEYKHYSPEVPLVVVEGSIEKLQEVVYKKKNKYKHISVLATIKTLKEIQADAVVPLGDHLNDVAVHLYRALRNFEKGDTDLIICEAPSKEGIGRAIMNRLEKAADEWIK